MNCKECDHLLPFTIAITTLGIETTNEVYKRMVANGLRKKIFKKKVKKNYFWTHRGCNNKKRAKNPAQIYYCDDFNRLRARPNERVIDDIISEVCLVRGIRSSKSKLTLVSGFSDKVQTLCDFVDAEIGALYQLFEGSGIAQELFIPLIVEYYKSIIKLYAFDESIKFLESLEQDVFITPEQKKQNREKEKNLKAQKRALEKSLLKQYQTLKRDYFSRIKEGAVIILKTINEDELEQMIKANAGALFYNRINVPEIFSEDIIWINNVTNHFVRTAVMSMREDGIVIDQELFAHLVSFVQFYYSYKKGKSDYLRLYYMKEELTDETFREIFCQN
jgi:glutaredoxin